MEIRTLKIVGMMCVKNEARWIKDNVLSLFPLCDQVFMLDDHSTDDTAEICRAIPGVTMFDSPFVGFHEVRDKNFVLEKVLASQPDWVIGLDGDERLAPNAQAEILKAIASQRAPAYYSRIIYLWNDPNTIRIDGVYGSFLRISIWRNEGNGLHFRSPFKSNLHCTNAPAGRKAVAWHDVRFLHFGYMHVEDRLRKFSWYNEKDPNNALEDGYRHMIQGDPGGPAAELCLRHAGPLLLTPLESSSQLSVVKLSMGTA
jgi:glycosyltransferase involved in cell wall biosynthesis